MVAMESSTAASETAVLGGGCFWCLEAVFDRLRGVQEVESGYAGGRSANPTYEDVCSGGTGHAEVVRIVFDPAVLSFRDLLKVFFAIHDPTTKDRQGSDIGTQYRSVIFCQTPMQRADAEAVIAELNRAKLWPEPILTEIDGHATVSPAQRQPQRERERHERRHGSHEREQRVGAAGNKERRGQNLELREPARDPRHRQPYDERRGRERGQNDADERR